MMISVNLTKILAELKIADVSVSTIQRRLHEVNLHGRALDKKPLLTQKHIKASYEFGLKLDRS